MKSLQSWCSNDIKVRFLKSPLFGKGEVGYRDDVVGIGTTIGIHSVTKP